jgi:glucokinase
MLLAGDIGATKTALGVFSPDAGPRAPLAEASFPSAHYTDLETLVREFLAQVNLPVDRASFGVAGPIAAGRATVTNLHWVIDEARLRETLHLSSVRLLNDLEAIAHVVPQLGKADLFTLHAGEPLPGGALAVIAPGTGLGEAFLTWDGSRYRAHPSEGGHANFAPTDEREVGLLRYLLQRFGHVSYERVCSGLGLPNIYAYLRDTGYAEEPAWLAAQLAAAEDPTPVIAGAALGDRPCDLCAGTLEMFASILGAEAGNLALKVLATGGVYLGGGIPRRILPVLTGGRFLEAFRNKGRLADLVAQVPVHVIVNPKVALLGAAAHGLEPRTERGNEQ